MSRKKENKKVQLHVWISPDLNQAFRNMIAEKYGNYERGLLSLEVELALRNYLGVYRTMRAKPNPHPPSEKNKVYETWLKVKDYLIRQYMFDNDTVHVKLLREAIGALRGNDRRTINKWIASFVEHKILKPESQYIYRILPPVGG